MCTAERREERVREGRPLYWCGVLASCRLYLPSSTVRVCVCVEEQALCPSVNAQAVSCLSPEAFVYALSAGRGASDCCSYAVQFLYARDKNVVVSFSSSSDGLIYSQYIYIYSITSFKLVLETTNKMGAARWLQLWLTSHLSLSPSSLVQTPCLSGEKALLLLMVIFLWDGITLR